MIKWLNFIQDNIIMTIFSGLRPDACDKVHLYVIPRLMILNKNPSLTLPGLPGSGRQEVRETTGPSLSILQVRTGSLKLIQCGGMTD